MRVGQNRSNIVTEIMVQGDTASDTELSTTSTMKADHGAVAHRANDQLVEEAEAEKNVRFDPKNFRSEFLSMLGNDRIMAYVYLSIWFTLNVVITLYSKAIFSIHKFPYPMLMTVTHLFFTSLGVQICAWTGLYQPKPLTRENVKTVLWFSVIFTANIWLSNASLMAVSVNLHQVVRTTIPLFTMGISLFVFKQSYSCTLLPSIVVVIVGVAATVWGDMEFDTFGMTIVVIGCVLSALKGILTQRTQVGALGMTSMDLLRYLSPLAVVQLLFLSVVMGEMGRVIKDDNLTRSLGVNLFFLGWVAFALNFVSFRNAALNNPLTLNIAGNVKQVLTSMLSIWIFGGVLSPALTFGIICTALGAFWYSWEMQRCRAAKMAISQLLDADHEKAADGSEVVTDSKRKRKSDLEEGYALVAVKSPENDVSSTASTASSSSPVLLSEALYDQTPAAASTKKSDNSGSVETPMVSFVPQRMEEFIIPLHHPPQVVLNSFGGGQRKME